MEAAQWLVTSLLKSQYTQLKNLSTISVSSNIQNSFMSLCNDIQEFDNKKVFKGELR
jgi:hypothetical protein